MKLGLRNRAASFVLIFSVMATTVLLFQNCGQEMRLTPPKVQSILPEKLLNGQYCTRLSDGDSKISKFIFILDMSRSNLGTFKGRRFSFETGTDVDGKRFDQIEQFINGCGSSSPNNKFQVVIFSDAAGVPTSSTSVGSSLSCRSAFTTAAGALATLSNVKAIQAREKAFWQTYTNKDWDASGDAYFKSGALFMMDTHYAPPLDCMSQIVNEDLQQAAEEDSVYNTFYMTDGQPYDKSSTCEQATDKYECYANDSANRTTYAAIDATAADRVFKMYPIYYGELSATDKQNALRVLDRMAQATGVAGAKSVADVSDNGDGGGGLVKALCELSQVGRRVDYRKELLSVINLSTKMVGGKLKADSDSDGLTDEEEEKLGYDPTNRRTFGLLDSICRSLGGPAACEAKRAQITCSGSMNNLGLADCDLAALGIMNSRNLPTRQFGIDSDYDGLPDLIEILRGTNPARDDANEDLDRDLVSNQTEINAGSDPERREAIINPYEAMRYDDIQNTEAPFCPAGSEAWEFALDQLPVLPVKRLDSIDSPTTTISQAREATFDFSHAANENLVLVTYKLVPANATSVAPQVWGTLVKVKVGYSKDGRYQPVRQALDPESFFFLGELK